MHELFSPESRFMQGLSRAVDLVLLNLVFLITCIPIFTIGSSLTALYSVVFAMGSAQEDGAIRTYFRSFRENFKSALVIWAIDLFVTAALVLDLLLINRLGGVFVWFTAVFGLLLILDFLSSSIVFPLLSLFDNSILGTIKNCLVFGLGQLPRAAAVAAMWLFPVLVLWRMPLTFFYAGFAWVFIYFSVAAYLSSLLLKPVFTPYLPVEEDAQ